MAIAETDRAGLLEMLGSANGFRKSQRRLVEPSEITQPPPNKLAVFWPEYSDGLDSVPNLIVTRRAEHRDFLAWSSTYLESYRPFTSLCRVIDWELYQSLTENPSRPQVDRCIAVFASMIIAEALTHGRGKIDPYSLNVLICESTYSFCRARTILLGYFEFDTSLDALWSFARAATGQPARVPIVEEIEPVWEVITNVIFRRGPKRKRAASLFSDTIAIACEELHETGQINIHSLLDFGQNNLDHKRLLGAMERTREERVLAFEDAVRRIAPRSNGSQESGFIVGYLASLLSPGSFEYINLVTSHLSEFPTLLLWYALCVGMHPKSSVLNEFYGLGRRVVRDLARVNSLYERPYCDMSIDELDILANSKDQMKHVPLMGGSSITIELLPLVNSVMRFGVANQPIAIAGDEQIVISREKTLSEVAKRVSALKDLLDGLTGETSNSSSNARRRTRKR